MLVPWAMSILLRTLGTAVFVFVAFYTVMHLELTDRRELALALRARGEAVTARIATHESGTRGSCNMALAGVTAAGRSFTARDSQPEGCDTAPAIGTPVDIVVLPDEPTRFMHAEWLAALNADGSAADDVEVQFVLPAVFAVCCALVVALVGYLKRRRDSHVSPNHGAA